MKYNQYLAHLMNILYIFLALQLITLLLFKATDCNYNNSNGSDCFSLDKLSAQLSISFAIGLFYHANTLWCQLEVVFFW